MAVNKRCDSQPERTMTWAMSYVRAMKLLRLVPDDVMREVGVSDINPEHGATCLVGTPVNVVTAAYAGIDGPRAVLCAAGLFGGDRKDWGWLYRWGALLETLPRVGEDDSASPFVRMDPQFKDARVHGEPLDPMLCGIASAWNARLNSVGANSQGVVWS